ncbi:hypothetical protein [Providencia heimbachae]|uniref:IpaD/SipD/SspD family type III secretion system needle tip protein n=1 Tax=Providencia heimbachae ATCC 35613 TaxID=1354272 RepID=A0A1B7JTZ1_9GAMM|nr:hypothetical protein [Providencia heimbachae]OAT51386.1 hypothetical protein M998_2323 [Providencia heimbachae ATCC 35613]SQH11549.1 type III effector protein IpaD/SipD/SspD [Providencia heimbachae]
MMDILSTAAHANNFPQRPVVETTEAQVGVTPLFVGDGIILDPQADLYQQADQAFQQLGYEVATESFRENIISSDLGKIEDQRRDNVRGLRSSRDKLNQLPKYIAESVEDGRAHIQGLNDLIDNIHSGYQKKYGEVIKATTTYMQDVNTAIGKMSNYVEAGSDGKIYFKPEAFLISIDNSISKYSGNQFSGSGPGAYFGNWKPNLSNATPLITIQGNQQEYLFWEKKLAGQGFIVEKVNGNIKIYPDFKPIKEIFSSIANSPAKWDGSDMMTQSFQSLQTAIDGQKNTINSSVSRLLETFRQDNSHFETLVQLLIQLIKDLHQNNNGLINM